MAKRKPAAQRLWDVPEDEFAAIIVSSHSFGEVLRKFNSSSAYALRQIVTARNIDTSHFPSSFNPLKMDYSKILTRGRRARTHLLNRAFDELKRPYRCEMPGCPVIDVWNGKSITLQFDHVNGDNTDNRIENLRRVCANCHSQTDTWGKQKNGV